MINNGEMPETFSLTSGAKQVGLSSGVASFLLSSINTHLTQKLIMSAESTK